MIAVVGRAARRARRSREAARQRPVQGRRGRRRLARPIGRNTRIDDVDTLAEPVAIPVMQAQNTHDIARSAEQKILWVLHRFGYLTAAQVAQLVYTNHAQSRVMARRTLARMNTRKLVLIKKGEFVYSEQHYALSEGGARAVFQLTGSEARSGKDLIREPSRHRDAANSSAIQLMFEGYKTIWTEREIQIGLAPFKFLGAKIPDALAADEEGYCTWVEVEASRRGGRDMQHLVAWLVHTAFPPQTDARLTILNSPKDTLYLSEVRFVIADSSAATFPQRLARALSDHEGIKDVAVWAEGRLQFQSGCGRDVLLTSGFAK